MIARSRSEWETVCRSDLTTGSARVVTIFSLARRYHGCEASRFSRRYAAIKLRQKYFSRWAGVFVAK